MSMLCSLYVRVNTVCNSRLAPSWRLVNGDQPATRTGEVIGPRCRQLSGKCGSRPRVTRDQAVRRPQRGACRFHSIRILKLFMELSGGLEPGRRFAAKAGRGGGKLNALVGRFRLLRLRGPWRPSSQNRCLNEALQATGINTFYVIRPPPRIATSNTGFEARHGVGASISHLRSLLWRNICLFRRCPGSPQSLPNLLLSIGLSCRNRSGDR